MNTFPAFSIFFHVCEVDFDFTALKKDYRFANNPTQKGHGTYHDDQYRILENHLELKNLLEFKFDRFFENLYGVDCKNKITTSWMTRLERGEEIPRHNHRNCQWSGVLYYGEYDDNSCPLMFENPLPALFCFDHKADNDCPAHSDVAIPPNTGYAVFFPAYLPHYSRPHNTDIPRQSLAFNFVPTTHMVSGDSSLNYEWITNQNL